MATEIIMPKFGFTQEESTIVMWLKEEGDPVEKGEPIAEVTTDKVDMEVEAPEDGILGGVRYQEGETVPVTEVIAYVLAEGEEAPATVAKPAEAAAPAEKAETGPRATEDGDTRPVSVTPVARRMAEVESVDLAAIEGTGPAGKITRHDVETYAARRGPARSKVRATPAARRVASEEGVQLADVKGSGARGRIQEADVVAFASEQGKAQVKPAPEPKAASVPQEARVIPLEGMRRTIAKRMQASYQQAPHINFSVDVDMTKAISLRQYANEQLADAQPGISMTALIVKAAAWALGEHPLMNAHFYEEEEQIVVPAAINVGVAVALEEGLIVPVVHNADHKNLRQIGADIHRLARRAREGGLRGDDLAGGTFTVSNLGMFGIDRFTAIINTPEVGILAVGRVEKRFIPDEDDNPLLRPMMTITLAADHRVIDGAVAARFLSSVRAALEDPARILI